MAQPKVMYQLGLRTNKSGNVSIRPDKNVFGKPWNAGPAGPYQGHSSRPTKSKGRKRKA